MLRTSHRVKNLSWVLTGLTRKLTTPLTKVYVFPHITQRSEKPPICIIPPLLLNSNGDRYQQRAYHRTGCPSPKVGILLIDVGAICLLTQDIESQSFADHLDVMDRLDDGCLSLIFWAVKSNFPFASPPTPGEIFDRNRGLVRLREVWRRWKDLINSEASLWNCVAFVMGECVSMKSRRGGTDPEHQRFPPFALYIVHVYACGAIRNTTSLSFE